MSYVLAIHLTYAMLCNKWLLCNQKSWGRQKNQGIDAVRLDVLDDHPLSIKLDVRFITTSPVARPGIRLQPDLQKRVWACRSGCSPTKLQSAAPGRAGVRAVPRSVDAAMPWGNGTNSAGARDIASRPCHRRRRFSAVVFILHMAHGREEIATETHQHAQDGRAEEHDRHPRPRPCPYQRTQSRT